jgi:hypothetical protein
MRRLLAFLGLAIAVAGCTVNLSTAREGDATVRCVLSSTVYVLAADERSGLGIQSGTGTRPIVWPVGFSARREVLGRIALIGPDGAVIAHEGDGIFINGDVEGDNIFHACPFPNIAVVATPSPQ